MNELRGRGRMVIHGRDKSGVGGAGTGGQGMSGGGRGCQWAGEGLHLGRSGFHEQGRGKWVRQRLGAQVWHHGQVSHQVLQELFSGVEFQGARRPHVLHVVQVGDGKVEGERQ